MRVAMAAVLVLGSLGGCSFARGFADTGAKMAGEISADALGEVVDAKLGDDFKELSEAVKSIPGSIPPPPADDPMKEGLGYTLGGLVAYIVGSFGKGMIREKLGKKLA